LHLAFAVQLPAPYQGPLFDSGIPTVLTASESSLRVLLVALTLFMPLRVRTRAQRIGLGLYLVGVLLYFGSWAAIIAAPESSWSTSAAGFLAPAYTPLLWLFGVAWAADDWHLPFVRYRPWIFASLSVLFVAVHLGHAALVFSRL
jgi:hypothetical protein